MNKRRCHQDRVGQRKTNIVWLLTHSILVSGLLTFPGCIGEQPIPKPTSTNTNVDGSKYVLNAEPEGGQDVIKAKETAKDDEEVVVVGRIGGREKPWVEGRAAFSIVDPSLKSCLEVGYDNCLKPWDYC